MSSLEERIAKQLMDMKQGIERTKELLEQTKRVHEDGMQLIKKHELEVKEEEEARNKKQKKEEDDDEKYIIVCQHLPQPHDYIEDEYGGCENMDMEVRVRCYKIPFSDLGKEGTPFASCKSIDGLCHEFNGMSGTEPYRVYLDYQGVTPYTTFELSPARYRIVFI